MASCRRSMSVMQRDGAAQNGEVSFDMSSPPTLPHNSAYFAVGSLLGSIPNSLNFSRIALQRTGRPVERSKPKGLHLRHYFFHFVICFMIGVFIGFAPLVSVHVSTNLASKQQVFSFKEGSYVEDARRRVGSVENDNLLLDKPPDKNRSFERLGELTVRNESVGASRVIPVSGANSSFEDWELVPRKLLIIITPTYNRPFQAYYLNRLAHTLRVVPPPLLWIVVEMPSQSAETTKVLRDTGVMYRHLVCDENVTSIRNREVYQRNVALSHIEKHRLDGVVHFADDDRMYSVELFDQMRQIRRFGAWPVAVLSESKNKVLLEGPVCNDSQVIGWHTNQRNKLARRFHLDMSGFAFNSTILWDPTRWHLPTLETIRQQDRVKEGYQETIFIEQLVEDESQMDGFPSDCSKVMVWHLHLESPELFHPKGWLLQKNLEVVVPLS